MRPLPCALAHTRSGFRFLTGLTSSPALATGAATLIDLLGEFEVRGRCCARADRDEVAYGLSVWVLAACASRDCSTYPLTVDHRHGPGSGAGHLCLSDRLVGQLALVDVDAAHFRIHGARRRLRCAAGDQVRMHLSFDVA